MPHQATFHCSLFFLVSLCFGVFFGLVVVVFFFPLGLVPSSRTGFGALVTGLFWEVLCGGLLVGFFWLVGFGMWRFF